MTIVGVIALLISGGAVLDVLNPTTHPTWVNDRETQAFLVVNDAALHHYGYTREEFLSMSARELRPPAEVELSRADAEQRGIKTGDEVMLSGGGASVTLSARISKNLRVGVARVAREHAGGVLGTVEVARAEVTA